MALGLGFLGGDEAGGSGTTYALAGHFANYLGGGEDLFLWLARHGGSEDLIAADKRGPSLRSG